MTFDQAAPPPDAAGKLPTPAPGESGEQEAPEAKEESPETATLSLEMFGGNPPTEGATISLQVTAVDTENGTVTVTMPTSGETGGGIAGDASVFDKGM